MQQMNSFTEGMVTTAVCVLQSEKDRSVLDFESFIFSRGSQILTATVKHTHTHTYTARPALHKSIRSYCSLAHFCGRFC